MVRVAEFESPLEHAVMGGARFVVSFGGGVEPSGELEPLGAYVEDVCSDRAAGFADEDVYQVESGGHGWQDGRAAAPRVSSSRRQWARVSARASRLV